MIKTARYIIGLSAALIALYALLASPPDFLIYPELPHLFFLRRAFSALMLCVTLCFYKVIMGPVSLDRIVAMDMLGMLIISFCAVFSVSTGRSWYIDVGIAWALQWFVTILAFGKYYEGRDFDE